MRKIHARCPEQHCQTRSWNRQLHRRDYQRNFYKLFLYRCRVDSLSDGVLIEQDFKRCNTDSVIEKRRTELFWTIRSRVYKFYALFSTVRLIFNRFYNPFSIGGTVRGFQETVRRPMCPSQRYFSCGWIWKGKHNDDTCLYFPRKSRTRAVSRRGAL